MKQGILRIDPFTADPNGISVSASVLDGADLVLGGVLATGGVATLDTEAHVDIESGTDVSAGIFVVEGARNDGSTVIEAIAGGAALVSVSTRNAYKTIRRITYSHPAGTTAATTTAGFGRLDDTAGVLATRWFILDPWVQDHVIGLHIRYNGAATGTVTVHTTDVNMMYLAGAYPNAGIKVASERELIYPDPASQIYTGIGTTGVVTAASAVKDSSIFAVHLALRLQSTVVVANDSIELMITQQGGWS